MKILLVDKQTLILDGIANLITRSAHELAAQANSVDDALTYFSETEFDILIADFNLIDNAGLSLIRKLKRIYTNLKIVVLSMQEESIITKELLKNSPHRQQNTRHLDLIDALETVNTGQIPLNDEIRNILNKSFTSDAEPLLTKQELKVLQLIADEYSSETIANKLAVTVKSVEAYRKSIYRKTETSSTFGLLKYAYANQLL